MTWVSHRKSDLALVLAAPEVSMTAFSTLVRTATHEQHTETKASTFMSDLLGGRLGVDA